MKKVLFGSDDFRLRLREKELANAFQEKFSQYEIYFFDGRDEIHHSLLTAVKESLAGGLFSVPRIVIFRHIEQMENDLQTALLQILSETVFSEDVLCIAHWAVSGRAKKLTALQNFLVKNFDREEIKTLSAQEGSRFVQGQLQKIDPKKKIDARACDMLMFRTQADSGRLYHELWKLALLPGEVITPEMVQAATQEPETDSVAFSALDALIRGEKGLAVSLLRKEETGEDSIFRLFGLFAWQLRQALMVRDEYERGTTSAENIARNIGAQPFSVKKLFPLLPKLTLIRLKRALAYLAQLDQMIKTGQIKPGVALDLFVWKF